jgi:hypothetical protein
MSKIMNKLHSSNELSSYGKMVGALAKGLDYAAMERYATDAEFEGYLPFGGYSEGYDFCISGTYCAKFVRGVGSAGGIDWGWDSFTGEANVDDVVNGYKTSKITIE